MAQLKLMRSLPDFPRSGGRQAKWFPLVEKFVDSGRPAAEVILDRGDTTTDQAKRGLYDATRWLGCFDRVKVHKYGDHVYLERLDAAVLSPRRSGVAVK